jgi:hypothetical protein
MRIPILIVSLVLAAAQAPPADVAALLSQARADVAAAVPSGQQGPIVARLERAESSVKAGRAYLALYLMESPFESASAFDFARSAKVTTSAAFLETWTALGPPAAPAAAPGDRPAVVDALTAAAEGRAAATYQASRPYAEDSGVDAGLYYLGESRALLAFAARARALAWPAAPPRPPFRSIAREIAALDAEMTAKYETMARGEHPTYISASAALKQARSLDDAGQYPGALFEYLLSRYLFATVRSAAAQDATVERIAQARRSLPGTGDHSIAELFLQLAEEGVSSDAPAQRRGAAAALEDVIPAYLAAIAAPPATTAPTAAAQVTITLVRWPFT